MFNKYYDNRTTFNSPGRIDVHEHKAPTDESIRLLNEFHDKAVKNIVDQIRVENNTIKADVIYFYDNMAQNKINYWIKFELNGMPFEISDSFDKREFEKEAAEKYFGLGYAPVYEMLMKMFSAAIASTIFSKSTNEVNKFFKL